MGQKGPTLDADVTFERDNGIPVSYSHMHGQRNGSE